LIIDFCHSADSYDDILGFYGRWDYTCPKCKAEHTLERHAFYTRYLIMYSHGSLECRQMKILRLQCSLCHSTHAILTADIVPFLVYSFSCILYILQSSFGENGSISKTRDRTGISYQVIYHFLLILTSHSSRITALLHHQRMIDSFFGIETKDLPDILLKIPPPSFCIDYFCVYHIPLLMARHSTMVYRFFIDAKIQ